MKKPRNKVWVLIGGLAVLLMGLLATVVLAQTATPEAATPESDTPSLRGRGWPGFGRSGSDSDLDQYLAEALGITVEQLQAARDQAYAAWAADAVAAGQITQAQADQLLAARALKRTLDREALLAEALGLSVEEVEAALAGGSLSDLLEAQGITAETLQANLQAAYEAAVARAVADGVITQAQADEILSRELNRFGLFGGHGRHGGGGHHGRGGSWNLPAPDSPDEDAETTDTGFDL